MLIYHCPECAYRFEDREALHEHLEDHRQRPHICDICGASGYYQRGNQVVCILCDVVMNIATIGFAGGCNPVPLKYEIIDGNMVIRPAHLEAEKGRFK